MTESRENPVDLSASRDRPRRALLIGVAQDIERRLHGLTGRSIAAQRDAEAVRSLLKASFTQAELLIDPDRQQFEEEVYALARDSQSNDVLLVYYSGQGFVDKDGKLYLAAANTCSNTLGELNKTTAIALTSLQALLNECPAQQVVILDCSFTGADSQRLDLAAQLGAPNRVIMSATSTADYTTAHKQAALSLYTEFLQEAIATGCGLPPGTAVTTHQIHHYIRQRMQQVAPAVEPQISSPHPEFEVAIAVAPALNEPLIYRSEVEARSQTGKISDFDRLILNWRRDQLGLSPDTASQIEGTVLKPHQTYAQNCQRYRDTRSTIAQSQYPFGAATQMALAQYRQQLGLSADRADAIAKETLAEPEQRYRQNLQQYEQYLGQQIQSGAWLDRYQRNEFRYLEQQLHLSSPDLTAIRQRHPVDHPPISDAAYTQRLQDYQQFFFDQFQPDRALSLQTLAALDARQQELQLQNLDVALAEEATVQQKRDRYEADLQRYQQELLMADDSPSSRARLKQMQRGLSESDIAIAAQIAALLNPHPEKPAPPPTTRPEQMTEPPPVNEAVAIETIPESEIPTQPPRKSADVEPAAIEPSSEAAPGDRRRPPREPLPARADKLKPWERKRLDRAALLEGLPETRRPSADAPPASASAAGDDRSLPLRLLKAILFAIVAVVVGRFVIAQILRILPYPIDTIVAIPLFALIILFAWKQIDQLR